MTTAEKNLESLKNFLLLKIVDRKLHSRTLERVITSRSYFPEDQFNTEEIKDRISKLESSEWEGIQKFTSYQIVCDLFLDLNKALNEDKVTDVGIGRVLFSKETLSDVFKAKERISNKRKKKKKNLLYLHNYARYLLYQQRDSKSPFFVACILLAIYAIFLL